MLKMRVFFSFSLLFCCGLISKVFFFSYKNCTFCGHSPSDTLNYFFLLVLAPNNCRIFYTQFLFVLKMLYLKGIRIDEMNDRMRERDGMVEKSMQYQHETNKKSK